MPKKPTDFFQALFEKHNAVMLVIDPGSGAIIHANLAAARFYGYPVEVLQTLNIADINILTRQQIHAEMAQAKTSRRNCFKFPHRLASGEIRTVEVHSSLLRVEERELLFSIIHDITEQEIVSTALRASEERYRALFEHSLDGILLTRPDGSILAANPSACRMFGMTEAEICAAGRTGLVDCADPRLARALEERQQTGRARADLTLIRKNGERFPVAISSQLFRDQTGVATCMIFRDISERSQAAEELRQSEERFRILCNTAPVGIFQSDGQGNNVYVNPCWRRMAGLSEAEAAGQGWRKVIHPEDLPRLEAAWLKAVKNQASFSLEHRQVRPDGQVLRVKAYGNPLLDAQGQMSGYMGVVVDITEVSKLQDEVLKAQKLESLGVLAGGIAHDFNNILTGLVGSLSLAELHIEPGHKAQPAVHAAATAAQRATELARQLLTFAKGNQPLKRAVNIPNLLQEVVSFALRGTNVMGCFDFCEPLPAVAADEGQLHQVFSNLIINATQAMPGGGKLFITAEEALLSTTAHPHLADGAYLKLSIADSGCGIPESQLEKIFDPYFSTKSGGTGLGLATAYSIMQKHGGAIEVQSLVGKGTTFTLLLPVTADAPQQSAEPAEPSVPRGRSETILVMDDEVLVRDLAAMMLEHLGYGVVVCASGEEAVELYRHALATGNPFWAAIMDLTVPGGMGGKEAAQVILSFDKTARMIVSSGYSSDPILAESDRYGFVGALVKPYRVEDMARVLDHLADRE